MTCNTSRLLTLVGSCFLLAGGGQAAGDNRTPLATDKDPSSPFLERGDYPKALERAVAEVLRSHRFTAPWLVVKGPEDSIWIVAERIESAHRFDRLTLRVLSNGQTAVTITPYQFGPSDWASLGRLFADFEPESKEIAGAVTRKYNETRRAEPPIR
jgi:hypothetical protein